MDRVEVSAQPFWNSLDKFDDGIAVVDTSTGERLSYRNLNRAVEDAADRYFSPQKQLAIVAVSRCIEFLVSYLGMLRAGHAILLVESKAKRCTIARAVELLGPELIVGFDRGLLAKCGAVATVPLFAELGVVLPTSGSMGHPKYARLSRANLATSAEQVREALGIHTGHVAVTSLPLHHVYGLSVLHGHLSGGGTLVLNDRSILDRRFWADIHEHRVSSLACVPWTFQAMRQQSVSPADLPFLTLLTNSAGYIEEGLRDWLLDACPPHVDVLFMYGQTEASGRISVLPGSLSRGKRESVGFPVPAGAIQIAADGEIIFQGPNVMLGYAWMREDLSRGDELRGSLATGDIGWLDDDNCLYLSGRRDRICKMYGVRLDLDAVEAHFRDVGEVAAVSFGGRLLIYCESHQSEAVGRQIDRLIDAFELPRASIDLHGISAIPRSDTGKIMYSLLT